MEIFKETVAADDHSRSLNAPIGSNVGIVAEGACSIQVFNTAKGEWQTVVDIADPFSVIFHPPTDLFRILDTSGSDNAITLSV